jgi:hypothetical protein
VTGFSAVRWSRWRCAIDADGSNLERLTFIETQPNDAAAIAEFGPDW